MAAPVGRWALPPRAARGWGIGCILLAAFAAVLPEMVRGNSCGHDFNFHLISWMDALRAWRAGIPYPHWAPSANWGAGEPRFVFYPPLTWMLGAALGALMPWSWVPTVLTFLLLAATGLGTRCLAREVFASASRKPRSLSFATDAAQDHASAPRDAAIAPAEAPATLAGCVAIFCGYALFTAYERTAFAELAGGLWMPLLLHFALRGRLARGLRGWRSAFDGSAVGLALVVAGAWLSNPTVAVMACYLLVALALLTGWLERTLAPLLRAAVALLIGMGLTAVYLVPVALEQSWADLNQVNLSPGQTLENNWLFARHAEPVLQFHDQVLRQVSLIAVAMVAVALLAVALCWWRGRLPGSRRWWLPMALLPLGVLLLQWPISHPVWVLLPKLRYLQFPWRWLVALEAPMGIFLAAAVWPRGARWQRWLAAGAAAVVFAACILHASRFYFQVCDEQDAVSGTLAAWDSGLGFHGMDEYVPPGADNNLVAIELPDACLVGDPLTKLGVDQPAAPDAAPDDDLPPPLWQPAQGSCRQVFSFAAQPVAARAERYGFRGVAAEAGFVVLKLHRYPAWTVQVNGHAVSAPAHREDGLLAVPVPAGPLELTVGWRATPDVRLGRWVSLFSVLLLTALFFLERRMGRAQIE